MELEAIMNRFVSNSGKIINETQKDLNKVSIDEIEDSEQISKALAKYDKQISNLSTLAKSGDFRKSNLQGVKYVFAEIVGLQDNMTKLKEKAKALKDRKVLAEVAARISALTDIRELAEANRKEAGFETRNG